MRARRETEKGTGGFDPDARRARISPIEQATPTYLDASIPASSLEPTAIGPVPGAPSPVAAGTVTQPGTIDQAGTIEQATPTELMARPERSEPIRVFSMKERAASQPRGDATPQPRVPLHVQLRSMAEVAGVHDRPDLGHLAPPRDPRQARARRRRDNLLWGCVALALACGISLAIWLIAGR